MSSDAGCAYLELRKMTCDCAATRSEAESEMEREPGL